VVGELVARGRNITPGYLDDPEETAKILRDGWLWTGDLAERDEDGFLYHRGRAREILKVGGHRVSPMEIEQVMAQHPDIAEVVIIGVPDPLLGEVPVAIVVPHAGTNPDERDVLQFCRANLSPRRIPARIVIVESLPRNDAGKPLRHEISRVHGGR
jgi:acyl-CoA synthetase (AMP-forming)/AMP-acid ligase II